MAIYRDRGVTWEAYKSRIQHLWVQIRSMMKIRRRRRRVFRNGCKIRQFVRKSLQLNAVATAAAAAAGLRHFLLRS